MIGGPALVLQTSRMQQSVMQSLLCLYIRYTVSYTVYAYTRKHSELTALLRVSHD